ncbi:MAG: DNA polymerase III subunit beta [Bacteroidaceae bacterium]|nr:DNA polymerase III subunit beta [Bacteroidaceae bacterium]
MKFTVSSSALSGRMQAIGRVISPKNSINILECFVFDIKGNTLSLTASDNENTLTTTLELVDSEKDVRFCVGAKTVQDAIKEIPEQPLEFFLNEETREITVVYQNGQYKFMAQSADEYPTPPADTEEVMKLQIPATLLLAGIGRALFATADDTLRPVMNGIYFDVKEGGVTMVASDGHKMACSKALNVPSETDGAFILPKKPATLARTLFAKAEGDIEITFSARNAVFRSEGATMNCRLIEGRYPNYASVIRQDNPNLATVNRAALLSALRRVLIFSSATSALVKLQIDGGKMTVSSQNIDFSMSAEESLLCDYQGTPLSIGFKGTFLTELLQNVEGDEITFQLADASRAGIIVPVAQPEGEQVQMLLMPMMLNN